eukprot:scaffold139081_cov19-Tisochrysis_lutea.AAC.1
MPYMYMHEPTHLKLKHVPDLPAHTNWAMQQGISIEVHVRQGLIIEGNSLGSFVAPSWLEREQSRLLYGFTGCMTTCTPLSGIHSGHRVAWSKALGKATPKLSNIRSKAGCKHPELAGCCMLAVGVTYLVWRRWCPRPGAGTSSWRAHVPLRACTRGYPWTLGSTTQQVIEAASLKAMPSTGSGWGGVHSVAPSGHPQHVFQDVAAQLWLCLTILVIEYYSESRRVWEEKLAPAEGGPAAKAQHQSSASGAAAQTPVRTPVPRART